MHAPASQSSTVPSATTLRGPPAPGPKLLAPGTAGVAGRTPASPSPAPPRAVSAAVRSAFGPAALGLSSTNSTNSATAPAAKAPTSAVTSAPALDNDGLPMLPIHAAAVQLELDPALALIGTPTDLVAPPAVGIELYGDVPTRDEIRALVAARYAEGEQGALPEMTLRIDTELELLRRQCFAARNAQWDYLTPERFALAEAAPMAWFPGPYLGPRRQRLLLRKRHERQRLREESAAASGGGGASELAIDLALGADHAGGLAAAAAAAAAAIAAGELPVRERPWPPKEFALKPTAKPSRGGNRTSAAKKKITGMASVVVAAPKSARVCAECETQSSALWRRRPRQAQAQAPEGTDVKDTEEEDVCMRCYLTTQRQDLFEKMAAEKARRAREEAARAAAEARQLKKQEQQLKKKIKKLAQQQQQQQQQQIKDDPVAELEEAMAESSRLKAEGHDHDHDGPLSATITDATPPSSSSLAVEMKHEPHGRSSDEATAYENGHESRRRKDKKSKKDKKKKKKKKKKRDWDDSDSDDEDDDRDSTHGGVILPSPPQRQMDGFVYADRSSRPVPDHPGADPITEAEPEVPDEVANVSEHETPKASSSRRSHQKRNSNGNSSRNTSSSSSSKKRKAPEATPVSTTPSASSSSTRASRSANRSSSKAAATSPTPTSASPTAATPPSRKRARPNKKEGARERELRALGQYCPVCNMTYEEDDPSPFVCCDSCEMWVHAACDASLSAEALAALSESSDKYICPLCGGR